MKKLFVILSFISFAAMHAQKVDSVFNRKQEIVIDNNKYRIYNNYVTFGIGQGFNSNYPTNLLQFGGDYNFHLTRNYFQAGALLNGLNQREIMYSNIHAGAGYRKETQKYNFAAFGGLSYAKGYEYHRDIKLFNETKYSATGLYAQIQYTFKVKYDVGLGLTLMSEVNQVQSLFLFRVDLFFSGAFRGNKRFIYDPNKNYNDSN